MKPLSRITTCEASRDDYPAVRALIVAGLAERWNTYQAAFNPDLEDFAGYYGSSIVVVAKDEYHVVGCGVLMEESPGVGRIVRMSVSRDQRRTGVGSKVLLALLEAASRVGYGQVVLETTATWESAIAFYKAHDFIPAVIENGDQHFIRAVPDA
jgi:ribosomal protein S18 acetylase RimI-like enzyme